MTDSEDQAPDLRRNPGRLPGRLPGWEPGMDQAPNPETDSGPAGFIEGGISGERPGHGRERERRQYAVGYAPSAAFAAMSVRYWEPSSLMRATAV